MSTFTPPLHYNHSTKDHSSNKKHNIDPTESADQNTSLQTNDPDWDHKLATLFSIFENIPVQTLHNALISAKGDLEQAIPLILSSTSTSNSNRTSQDALSTSTAAATDAPPVRKKQKLIQPRLSTFLHSPTTSSTSSQSSHYHHSSSSDSTSSLLYRASSTSSSISSGEHSDSTTTASNLPSVYDRLRWKDNVDDASTGNNNAATSRIKPLILYNPEDVANHCPCTLIFNILPKELSNRLLQVMLKDSETWNRNRWWLFERMVESPHKTSYFADREEDLEEVAGWTYNGRKQDLPRQFLPEMNEAKRIVREKVNELRKTRTM